MQSTHPHRYRCTLIPADLLPEQVEPAADCDTLDVVQVQATNADAARRAAYLLTGQAVHDVVRLEETVEVAA